MSEIEQTPARPSVERAQLTRAVIASTIGTSIEWYDYFVYNAVAALAFTKVFLPHSDPLTGILEIYAGYFVGFLARPVGAAIFGHWGDRLGRKTMLIVTLLVMGIGTFLIGCLPGYGTIGIAGFWILTLLRVCQGLGVGGEWGGSVVLSLEWGHRGKRGFITSWPQFGVPMGLVLSTVVVALVNLAAPHNAFIEWGWRIPFLLSIVLVGVGIYVRLGIVESPVFSRIVEENKVEQTPFLESWRLHGKEILLSAFLRLPEQAPFYIFTTFVYTFGAFIGFQRGFLVNAVLVASLISLASVPIFGYLSDVIGRKRMYLLGIGVMAIWGFVYFGLYSMAVPAVVFLVIALSLIPHDMQYGPQAALISENMTGRVRYSASSLGYQLASVIAGGPAPYIATQIWAHTRNPYAIGGYILICCVLGLVATLLIRDRSRTDIMKEYDQREGPAVTPA
jgi:MFS family permease